MIIIQPLNLALFLFLWGKIDFEREEDRFAFFAHATGVFRKIGLQFSTSIKHICILIMNSLVMVAHK